MKFDYRALEAKAKELQDEVQRLTAKEEQTPEDRDLIMKLMGRIEQLEADASTMRDAELAELRAIVERGTTPGAGEDTSKAEMDAFLAYLKTGRVDEILNASMSTTDANGGYIVPEPAHAELIEKIRKEDPVFGRATLFRLTGDTSMVLPYKATHGVVANATEAGSRSEQDAPTLAGPTLTCYDYYSDQRATQTVLDSVAGLEDMLLGWMYEDIQEQAGADAVNGNGSTKIKGLFAETDKYTTKLSGSAGALANTAFLTTYFALPIKYRRSGAWLMNSTTLATVAAYAHPASANVLLAQQDPVSGEYKILGKPVLETDSAPAIGAANYPVAFADISRAYAVGIHRSTTILRDPYTATPKIRFYAVARMGGCAWDYQAAILLKSNNS